VSTIATYVRKEDMKLLNRKAKDCGVSVYELARQVLTAYARDKPVVIVVDAKIVSASSPI